MKRDKLRDISGMNMYDLVKHYYPLIKQICKIKSHKFFLDTDDVINEVNVRLSVSCHRNQFSGSTEKDFVAWLNTLIHNCAINVYRLKAKHILSGVSINKDDNNNLEHLLTPVDPECLSKKMLVKEILVWVENAYSKKQGERYMSVFKLMFLDQEKYEVIAEKQNLNINTVKTIIHKIRHDINKRFGDQYQSVMLN